MASWTHERAKVARLSQTHPAGDPEIIEARQRLKAARLEDHVRGVVDAWPPLTPEQLARVSALLQPAGGDAK